MGIGALGASANRMRLKILFLMTVSCSDYSSYPNREETT